MSTIQQNNAANTTDSSQETDAENKEIHSGVGVLDKTVKILDALEYGPATLGQLVSATGLARPTAHRLAIALERHRFVLRDQHGRFVLGSRFAELAAAAGEDRLLTAAGPILQTLLDRTGESAQIYRRQGDMRVCIAAVERASGLRDSIPVGAMLSMADPAGMGGFRASASGASPRQIHRGEAHRSAQARLGGIGERTRRGRVLHFRAHPQRLRPGDRRHFDFRSERPHGFQSGTPLRAAGHGGRKVPHRSADQGLHRPLTDSAKQPFRHGIERRRLCGSRHWTKNRKAGVVVIPIHSANGAQSREPQRRTQESNLLHHVGRCSRSMPSESGFDSLVIPYI